MSTHKKAVVNEKRCVACGCCAAVCKIKAIGVPRGVCAVVDRDRCVGCGLCAKTCPAGVIQIQEVSSNG